MTVYLPPVPSDLANVGKVIAAIPVHIPVDLNDPIQWVVVCDRGSVEPELVGDTRRFSTNRVFRRPIHADNQVDIMAEGGEYDLTYEKAVASLLDRANLMPRITEVTVWTLGTMQHDNLSTSTYPTYAAALQGLREEQDAGGDLDDVSDDDLIQRLVENSGWDLTVEINEHTVNMGPS